MNYTTTALVFSAVVQGGLALNDGYSAVDRVLSPPPIEGSGIGPDTVAAGQLVIVDWEITKRTPCSGTNARVWVGADGFYLSEIVRPSRLPSGPDVAKYAIQTLIPALAPPGPIVLTIVGDYKCDGVSSVGFELGPVKMLVVD